jgi:hypothetical protein
MKPKPRHSILTYYIAGCVTPFWWPRQANLKFYGLVFVLFLLFAGGRNDSVHKPSSNLAWACSSMFNLAVRMKSTKTRQPRLSDECKS